MSEKQKQELQKRLNEIKEVNSNPDKLFDLYGELVIYLQGVLDGI